MEKLFSIQLKSLIILNVFKYICSEGIKMNDNLSNKQWEKHKDTYCSVNISPVNSHNILSHTSASNYKHTYKVIYETLTSQNPVKLLLNCSYVQFASNPNLHVLKSEVLQ
jgi:hypothetical protein